MTTITALNANTDSGGADTPGTPSGAWSGRALRARARAAALSLLASSIVIGSTVATIAVFVHQLPFFWALGGLTLMAMIAGVDLVLGPLLTFIVYAPRKRSLRRDLAVIVLIQLGALGYGVHAALMARPVFMTFAVDRFELVSAAEIDEQELLRAPASMRRLSWTGPRIAAAIAPTDPVERETLLFMSTNAGIDLRHMLRYYSPYAGVSANVLARARRIAELDRYNKPARVEQLLAPYRAAMADPAALVYLPVQGRREDLCALLDARDARLIAVVRLRPW